MSDDNTLEALEKHFNTVGALWHDAYCEWQVKVDPQRRTFEDCRHSFWGETLSEACAAALAAIRP